MSESVVQIQPYNLNQATQIRLSLNYTFNATDCNIIVFYLDSSENTLGTVSVYIPPEVYDTWNQDGPIIEYILTQLNLTALV